MKFEIHSFFPSFFIGIPYPALNFHYAVDPQIPALFTSGWQIARQMITAAMGNSASRDRLVIFCMYLCINWFLNKLEQFIQNHPHLQGILHPLLLCGALRLWTHCWSQKIVTIPRIQGPTR